MTVHHLAVLSSGFNRLWPVGEGPCFSDLLEDIDKADRAVRQEDDSDRLPKEERPARCD
jgi:hypothetical protein